MVVPPMACQEMEPHLAMEETALAALVPVEAEQAATAQAALEIENAALRGGVDPMSHPGRPAPGIKGRA